MPILVNLPAFAIVMAITWLLLRGARESSTANNVMVVIKLVALGLFIGVGLMHIDPENYTPFAPNGFTGIHQGAAIVFFAYIGFDAISTAAEETKNPQRNLPIGILGGLAVCTVDLHGGRRRADRHGALWSAGRGRPVVPGARAGRLRGVGWVVALGAAVSMSAVLLVFQYGQPRIFFAMARDGLLPAWAARVDPEDAHSVDDDARDRRGRGVGLADRRCGGNLRPDQHRDAVRVRAGLRRRAGAAGEGARSAAAVPRARRGSWRRSASPPACS